MNTSTDNGAFFNNSAWMYIGGFVYHVLRLPATGAHH